MKQQTAVEWLKEKIKETYNKEGNLPLGYTLNLVSQAEVIEAKQIIKANRDGVDMIVNKENFITGEQYYNDVYGVEGTPDTSSPNIKNK